MSKQKIEIGDTVQTESGGTFVVGGIVSAPGVTEAALRAKHPDMLKSKHRVAHASTVKLLKKGKPPVQEATIYWGLEPPPPPT